MSVSHETDNENNQKRYSSTKDSLPLGPHRSGHGLPGGDILDKPKETFYDSTYPTSATEPLCSDEVGRQVEITVVDEDTGGGAFPGAV